MLEKDCIMEFVGEHPDHKFRARDLDIALMWAHNENIEIKCIRTPWGTLTMMDTSTYDKAMTAFDGK